MCGTLGALCSIDVNRTSSKTSVNDARKQLFAQKGRALDAIPPTRAALVEHAKRAAYQAGHC